MVYIVQYDLIREKDYSTLIAEIQKSSGWAHILESTWGVETTESAEQLFNRLNATTDSDDRLFLVKLEKDFAWWSKNLKKDVADWIRSARSRA